MSSQLGMRTLARRYARALVASSEKNLPELSSAMTEWMETLNHSPELGKLLNNPRVTRIERAELVSEILKKLKAPTELIQFIILLIDEDRIGLLENIYTEFMQECEDREGVKRVVVESADELSEEIRETIRSRLADVFRTHVQLEEKVIPDQLGGINIRIGSRVWYGSALARLEQIL